MGEEVGSLKGMGSSMRSFPSQTLTKSFSSQASLSSSSSSLKTSAQKSLSSKSRQSQSTKVSSTSPSKDQKIKKNLSDRSAASVKNEEIYRRFRVSVKQTDDYIHKIQTLSENRIEERCANLLLESHLNHEMDSTKELTTMIQHRYLLEVDLSLENRSQLRAQRQYHLTHIENLLPEWCQLLDQVKKVVGSCGHLNKLQWRSKARALLVSALELMEQEEVTSAVEDAIDIIRHLIRSINAYTAQHLLLVLSEVKEKYLKAIDSTVEGSLGDHCRQLRKLDEIFLKRPVPLLREEWSEDIVGEMKKKSTLQQTSLFSKTATTDHLPHSLAQSHSLSQRSLPGQELSATLDLDTHSMLSIFSEEDLGGLGGGEGVGTGTDFLDGLQVGYPSQCTVSSASSTTSASSLPLTSLPLLLPPPEKISNTSTAHQYLRSLSSKGQFQEAWGVFNSLYGDYVVYPIKRTHNNTNSNKRTVSLKDTHFFQSNLKNHPTLETFKLLFVALKNCSRYDAYDIYTLLNLMKRLEILPDVTVYNTILRTCEKEGAWRRALEFLHHMQKTYEHLLPNTNTYTILVDCCRHSVEDTPAVIFETLRNAGLPRKSVPPSLSLTVSLSLPDPLSPLL
jgi:hypothetical protein